MANIMTTYVKIKNLDESSHKKLVDLFQTEEKSFSEKDLLPHFNKLYDRNFNNTDNFYGIAFMNDNVGSKWLNIEFGCWSTEEFKQFSDTAELVLESAWNVPTLYLEKLTQVLTVHMKMNHIIQWVRLFTPMTMMTLRITMRRLNLRRC